MNPEEVRRVMIVQAVEQTDERNRFISNADRTEAASVAGAPLAKNSSFSEEHRFLAARAESIITQLISRYPDESSWLLSSNSNYRLGLLSGVLFLIALVAGFLSNELGPDRRINIISFPLLGILAWNLIIYVKEVCLFLRHRDSLFSGFWTEACAGFISPPQIPSTEDPSPLNAAQKLYARRWYEFQFPVLSFRIKSLLHFVALTIAAAAIGGMYVKGMSNEYRAIWESTFITDADQLQPFLNFVLGSAVSISGDALPSVEELNAMRWQSGDREVGGENAARWIHWYAITIGLFVLLPRTFLGLLWGLKSSRLRQTLPYRETCPHYFDHLLSISTGNAREIQVIPYSFNPDNGIKQHTVVTLTTALRCPVNVDWLAPIGFDNEESLEKLPINQQAKQALLFSFASTPEKETHLALFQTLSENTLGAVDYIILNSSSFDEKTRDFPNAEQLYSERLSAWKRMFCETNVEFLMTGSEEMPSSSNKS